VDAQVANIQVNNDGRPDFPMNPFNGPIPTYAQAIATQTRSPFLTLPAINANLPYTHQANIGVQRPARNSDVVGGGLRLHEEQGRRQHHGRQPGLQSRDGRSVSV
jgi:hypothetical protein